MTTTQPVEDVQYRDGMTGQRVTAWRVTGPYAWATMHHIQQDAGGTNRVVYYSVKPVPGDGDKYLTGFSVSNPVDDSPYPAITTGAIGDWIVRTPNNHWDTYPHDDFVARFYPLSDRIDHQDIVPTWPHAPETRQDDLYAAQLVALAQPDSDALVALQTAIQRAQDTLASLLAVTEYRAARGEYRMTLTTAQYLAARDTLDALVRARQ